MVDDRDVSPIALADGRVRVVVENITPQVDGGRFAVKRVVGERVDVEADCFADGHDLVACALLYRRAGGERWLNVRMLPLGNDRWSAGFVVDEIGPWQYTVCAWVDPFLSWRHDFARRVDPQDIQVAAATGARLVAEAAERVHDSHAGDREVLRGWADELAAAARAGDVAAIQRVALDEPRAAIAQRHPDLRHAWTHPMEFGVTVERERARYSTWYEFFPRSASSDPARHGTFADCEAWLPYVQRMGFDVLYFPPIHPIGRGARAGTIRWTRPATISAARGP
jgi:starch synthase (maltosyl-transferring)